MSNEQENWEFCTMCGKRGAVEGHIKNLSGHPMLCKLIKLPDVRGALSQMPLHVHEGTCEDRMCTRGSAGGGCTQDAVDALMKREADRQARLATALMPEVVQ